MLTMAENMIVAGADNRPFMLVKTQYSSWASLMLLYIKGKEHGKLLYDSVINRPFKYGTVTVLETQTRTYDELIDTEKIRETCDIKATNFILQCLPQDIYNLVNPYSDAKDIWDRVKLLIEGSEILLQERESKLYDEFDTFTSVSGEIIHSYYFRQRYPDHLALVANTSNTSPSYTNQSQYHQQLSPIAQQYYSPPFTMSPMLHHQYSLAPNANQPFVVQQQVYQPPDAHHSLVVHRQYYHAPTIHQPPQASFPQMDSGLVFLSFLPSDDLIFSLNKAMAFISTSFSSHYPPTNNQLRTSSDLRNQATIQDWRVTVQTVRQRLFVATVVKKKSTWQDSGPNQKGQGHSFDSDCNEAPSASVVLMAKLSAYESDILSEVPTHDTYLDNQVINQSVQEMQYFEQQDFNNDTDIDITSESNMISYEQYLKETRNAVVQDTSSTQQDALIMFVIKELSNQVAKCNEVDKHDALFVVDTEEILELAEESRLKMHAKQNDPIANDKKIDIVPIDYAALNKLLELFFKHFVPQKQLYVEQAFWLPILKLVSETLITLEMTKYRKSKEKNEEINFYTSTKNPETRLEIDWKHFKKNGNSFKPVDETSTDDAGTSTVWRNKSDLDTMSLDDLYNNFKIVELDIRGTTSSNTSNMAFMSSPSPNSTNEVPTVFGVSTASPQVSIANLSDATVYAFLSNQPNGSQLMHEDLEQIHKDDLEEIDLKWQLALLKNNGAPLIEDWESNDDDEVESPPEKETKTVAPSMDKVELEIPKQNDKPARRPVKYAEMYKTKRPKGWVKIPLVGKDGNISYHTDFNVFDGGHVAFGGGAKGGKITGKGTIRTGKLYFEDVYFVKELQFNLFSVSQMCDKKNSVLFTDTKCFVMSRNFKLADESHVLLKAINDESMLWHRRLGHINFKNINKLFKDNLVRGLPSKRFENDQPCVSSLKGKQHKVSFKSKIHNSISQPLFMLHMDLFGPTSDETSRILKSFITEIENLVDKKVQIIRCDNRTEFKNRVMNEFCEEKCIKREYSVARTPQQNENMILVVKPHFKTPYELFRGKFDGKSDEGFFVGYSINSKAFKVYNTRTRKVEENLNIKFLENKPLIAGDGPKWLFDIDTLIESMNYVPDIAGANSNDFAGKGASFDAGQSSMRIGPSQDYILMPLWNDGSLFDSSPKDLDGDNQDNDGPNTESEIDNQERPNGENNTKDINIVGPSINTTSLNINTASPTVNTVRLSDDFFGADNDMRSLDGVELDISNIYTTYPVLTTLNTRINKDHSLDNVIEPKRITNALKDPAWVEAMQEELLQFHLLKVWTLVDLPRARIEAIRMFLAYASFMGFLVYQMDVKSVFLYEMTEEEVYVCQPLGFEDLDYPDKVYKVEKALYGLHQAQRALYVDDIIFGSTKKELYTNFDVLMHDKFQMSSMGELAFFLGLQYEDVKPASTPIDKEKALLKDSDGDDVDVHLYRLSHSHNRSKPRTLIELYSSNQSLMANLEFCDKHNMVAFLKKPQGSDDFHQIVEFLKASHIRRHLKLVDDDGISTLPATEIFEQLALMGNMKRESRGFSRVETALLPTMLVTELVSQGEGPTSPVGTQHTTTIIESSPYLQNISITYRKTRTRIGRMGIRIPQSNVPSSATNEAITKEMYDGLGKATTTAYRLGAEQGSGNYTKSQTKATLSRTSSPRTSSEGGHGCHFTMGDSHEAYETAASPQTVDDETLAKTLLNIKRSAAKDKGKAIMQESESPKKIKKKEMMQIKIKILFDNTKESIRRLVLMESEGQAADIKVGEGSSKAGESLKRSTEEELGQEQKVEEEIAQQEDVVAK
uniref:Uncharacterized protein n=1 Tax=Tanacetum cinerariifolium TaxID=118510 RepID=A0A6L2JAJ1_TANCI|nr:hypothetical protein [Tanacetum cinerariifolium]